jgi:hypothetical protein
MSQTDRSRQAEDAGLCKPPGWVEDAEPLFQLSLRCTRWCYEDGTRPFDRGAFHGSLARLATYSAVAADNEMTLAKW